MKKNSNKDLPYEKFLQKGAESLTDAELLAILLRTGPAPDSDAPQSHQDCPALALAEQILALPKGTKSGLSGLPFLSPAELMKVKGIGEVKAVRICCLAELSRRIFLGQRKELSYFPTPKSVAEYCRPLFMGEGNNVEKTMLLLLDGKGKLIHEMLLTVGTVNAAMVSPREIFLQAFRYQAVHFMLLHNHPSGDAAPSLEDCEITQKLVSLGEMMQLTLLDHIILGEQEYFSFREAGLI
ncbi:MAG: DNA repair protein RadC [Lachnospiraceae bacterium]|nr:DNA repair protein RadC [Lachnospiraceae bacterium]